MHRLVAGWPAACTPGEHRDERPRPDGRAARRRCTTPTAATARSTCAPAWRRSSASASCCGSTSMAGTRKRSLDWSKLFELPDETAQVLASDDASAQLLRYPDRVHLRLVAMQPERLRRDGRQSRRPVRADLDRHHRRQERGRHRPSRPGDRLRRFPGAHPRRHGLGALEAADFLTVLVDSVLAVYLELVESDRTTDRRARRDRPARQRGGHVPARGGRPAAPSRRPAPRAGAPSLGIRAAGAPRLRAGGPGQAMARHRRPPGSRDRCGRERAGAADRRVRRVHGDVGPAHATTS